MGKRGPLPDPRAQGHRSRELTVVEAPEAPDVPRPPQGLLKITRDRWGTYWRSSVAQVAEDCDLPIIHRLFRLYDQHERAMKVVRKALAVKGSRGQIRLNPIADHALKLEAQILRLENELGLTPMARQRLGIAVGQAQMTLNDLNEALYRDDDDGDADEDDPRAVVIDIQADVGA